MFKEVCRTCPAPRQGKRRNPGLCLLPQGSAERQPFLFALSSLALAGTQDFSWPASEPIPGQVHPRWLVLCAGVLWKVACISSLQLAFCSHREKGLPGGFSMYSSILYDTREPTLSACSRVCRIFIQQAWRSMR